MSEERQHHIFHHKKEEDNAYPETGSYGSDGYNASGGGYGASQTAYGSSDYQTDQPGYTAGGGYGASESTYVEQTTADYGREEEYEKAKKEEKHHKHMEHGGELGAAAAGAFAMVSVDVYSMGISKVECLCLNLCDLWVTFWFCDVLVYIQ